MLEGAKADLKSTKLFSISSHHDKSEAFLNEAKAKLLKCRFSHQVLQHAVQLLCEMGCKLVLGRESLCGWPAPDVGEQHVELLGALEVV